MFNALLYATGRRTRTTAIESVQRTITTEKTSDRSTAFQISQDVVCSSRDDHIIWGKAAMPERIEVPRPVLNEILRDPQFRQKHEAKVKDLARRVVMRFSRGNVRLRRGAYFTREDIEDELTNLRELPELPQDR